MKKRNKWEETALQWEFKVTFKDGYGFEDSDTCSRPVMFNRETGEMETELEARKSIIYERQLAGFCVSKIERVEDG